MVINLILEKGDDDWWGSAKTPGFFISTVADTVDEVKQNVRDLVADHLNHEGKDDQRWEGVSPELLTFNLKFENLEDEAEFVNN